MTLTELIERVERATGPDRELDAEIVKYLGWAVAYDANDLRDREPYWQPVPDYSWTRVPTYTASLDATMTLVPDGFKWAVTSRNSACCHIQNVTPLDWKFCATPALALTAAALRARMGDEK